MSQFDHESEDQSALANELVREVHAMKKELTPESTPRQQMHALIDAAEHYDSDLVQFIGRDTDDKLLFVSVVAKGAYAKQLARFLKKLDKERP